MFLTVLAITQPACLGQRSGLLRSGHRDDHYGPRSRPDICLEVRREIVSPVKRVSGIITRLCARVPSLESRATLYCVLVVHQPWVALSAQKKVSNVVAVMTTTMMMMMIMMMMKMMMMTTTSRPISGLDLGP
ncbi:hypothetical protein ElyMa_001654200 [Elysia marginata]|uniref:Secreted protein n=1 Tax=Elysia marginata TaxID=1093978 RepID=A0AAV4JMW4_9GAST|nr:hypothetical protein ElyMa_001654200 [Elysia marginata]